MGWAKTRCDAWSAEWVLRDDQLSEELACLLLPLLPVAQVSLFRHIHPLTPLSMLSVKSISLLICCAQVPPCRSELFIWLCKPAMSHFRPLAQARGKFSMTNLLWAAWEHSQSGETIWPNSQMHPAALYTCSDLLNSVAGCPGHRVVRAVSASPPLMELRETCRCH